MTVLLINAINLFFQVLTYLILARAIMSWFFRPGDRLYPIYSAIFRITEPILMPCRRLIGRFGSGMGVDFSPIVAIFLIWVANWIVVSIVRSLLF
jgi:YggT family protein